MSIEYKKLEKPPITEVIIGIVSNNLFNSFDEIQEFYKNTRLNKRFKDAQELKTFSLEVKEEPTLGKTMSVGSMFSSENNTEQLNIEFNRIMFIDKNKYDTFDSFANKFYDILEDYFSFKKQNIQTTDIGLRYVNNFTFSNEKLNEKFCVKQNLSTGDKEKYANILNSLFVSQIESSLDPNITAIVKTIREKANEASVNVVFDIDTHISNIKIDCIDTFKTEILKLKNFKNEIFFSNFNNVYEIEDFKNGSECNL